MVSVMEAVKEEGGAPATGNTTDALIGIISICRGDFAGIERVAKLIGGYDQSRVGELLAILAKFSKFLTAAPDQPT